MANETTVRRGRARKRWQHYRSYPYPVGRLPILGCWFYRVGGDRRVKR
jgi:hypothetical protein